ncbi:DUF3750 domain-containing protein [Geminocystis sp. NIES-3709]|uniref:DUF3750 domain-containing protein n=1 Tax=Geminocystis sp. NIES-3709 TaxID=1617448 RepID=UPI0005FCC077|nr:DUF3750 domain-containing protein [Geminocystis sp. NIES-3709]BAQ66143.1 hypothetical protein GM3709_2908 [Geminocystis sp. NIES-3709]
MVLNVDLRGAKIPFIGYIAVHYWFVIIDDKQERWEIWQSQNLVSSSWGHLHKNLMGVTRGVGNGDSWLEKQWQGEEAQKLIRIIRSSPFNYPYNYLYRYYPGPNSNTYVQWILDEGKINYPLSWRGWGKYYDRRRQKQRKLREKN